MSKDEYLITDTPLKALTVFAMPMILGSFFSKYTIWPTLLLSASLMVLPHLQLSVLVQHCQCVHLCGTDNVVFEPGACEPLKSTAHKHQLRLPAPSATQMDSCKCGRIIKLADNRVGHIVYLLEKTSKNHWYWKTVNALRGVSVIKYSSFDITAPSMVSCIVVSHSLTFEFRFVKKDSFLSREVR